MNDFEILQYRFDRDIDIIPISDVHLGSMECKQKEWERFCKELIDNPDTYIILVGDLLDMGITNSKTNIYKQTMMPTEACDKMVETLLPIKDKILGIVEGNHERRVALATSFSPSRYIAARLGIESRYRESACFMILRFGGLDKDEIRNKKGSKRPTYTISAIHGATKTRDKNLGLYVDSDINITGHTHTPDIIPKMRYKFDQHNNKMTQAPFYHIVTSSWLDWGGYGIEKLYEPAAFCVQKIHLSNNKKQISILTI